MSDVTAGSVSEKDKIQILLVEYSTLRAEVVANGNRAFQLAATGSAILVFLMSQHMGSRLWIAVAVGSVGIGFLWRIIHRDTVSAAQRLRELEQDVNRRAGEELLVWERKWGAAATGFLAMKPPFPVSKHPNDVETHSG